MPDTGLHSALLAATIVIFIGAIPMVAYWRQMEFGQRVYACCLFLLIQCYFLFVPYRNPVDNNVHWGFV